VTVQRLPTTSGDVSALPRTRYAELRPLLADPAVSCFAEARIFPPEPRWEDESPHVLGVERAGVVSSAVLLGANLVPIGTDAPARASLANALVAMGRRCSSIVGPAEEVLPLWELLRPAWGPAREVRSEQPLLALRGAPAIAPDENVVPVPPDRLDDYLPASIAMFTEEVGVDPRSGGLGQLYRDRVGDLLRAKRAFARWDGDRVAFKAELGAVTHRAVQIQGVWVDPERRGQGLAAPGMAAVVRHSQAVAPLVTLYVNAYNTAALATYRSAGFSQVGTFATVLF